MVTQEYCLIGDIPSENKFGGKLVVDVDRGFRAEVASGI